MQIIIPMAGSGKRFQDAGYKKIKPLIAIDGKPMIQHVISLFPKNSKFIFICNNEHLGTTNLKKVLEKIAPLGKIVGIPSHKLGPVESVLQIKDYIDDKEPTIISYCDYYMLWSYKEFIQEMKKTNSDASLVCYTGFHPHLQGTDVYAGVRVTEKKVLEVKEKYSFTKNKMDSWHSAGFYYFKTGSLVKKYFEKTKKSKITINGERYVSMVYSKIIKDTLKVTLYPIDFFCQWGTPKDLQAYIYWSEYFQR